MATLHYTNFTEKWTDARISLAIRHPSLLAGRQFSPGEMFHLCFCQNTFLFFTGLPKKTTVAKCTALFPLCKFVPIFPQAANKLLTYIEPFVPFFLPLRDSTPPPPPSGPWPPHFRGVPPSHTDTPHSVRLLWTSDQPDADNSIGQHITFVKRHISIPLAVCEPTIRERERPQTDPLDRAASGIGHKI